MSCPVRRMPASALLAACLLAAWLLAGACPAAAQSEQDLWRQGTQAFRLVLHNLGFRPLLSPREALAQPERTIVIVLGETELLDRLPGGPAQFVEQGGAVLVATDRGTFPRPDPRRWVREFGVSVAGLPVHLPRKDHPHAYRELIECPVIKSDTTSGHPIFRGLPRGVATNRPSFVQRLFPDDGRLSTLAWFPKDCRVEHAWLPLDLHAFAVGGDWGDGRVLVLSDHSVFINDMMLQTDNDNIPFAYNCLGWLSEGKTTRRDWVLFLEEGVVQTAFDVPVVELPIPPLPPPGPWMNDLIQAMEEENRFNRAILSQVRPAEILRSVALLLTAALLLYGLFRLAKVRHRVDPAVVPLTTAVNRQVPLRAALQQRHHALLRSDNLREAARTLARECLEQAIGLAPASEPSSASADRPPPPFTAVGSWRERRRLGRQFRRLWQLAYGPVPEQVSAQDFLRLLTEMEQVKAALDQGTLRITTRAGANGLPYR